MVREMVMGWVCGKQSEKHETQSKAKFASLLAMEEASNVGKIDGVMVHLSKNLFCLFVFSHKQRCMGSRYWGAVWGKWLVEPSLFLKA